MPQHTLESIRHSVIRAFNESLKGAPELTEGPDDLLKTMKDLNADRIDIADVVHHLEMEYETCFPKDLKIRYGNNANLLDGVRVLDIYWYTVKLVLGIG